MLESVFPEGRVQGPAGQEVHERLLAHSARLAQKLYAVGPEGLVLCGQRAVQPDLRARSRGASSSSTRGSASRRWRRRSRPSGKSAPIPWWLASTAISTTSGAPKRSSLKRRICPSGATGAFPAISAASPARWAREASRPRPSIWRSAARERPRRVGQRGPGPVLPEPGSRALYARLCAGPA